MKINKLSVIIICSMLISNYINCIASTVEINVSTKSIVTETVHGDKIIAKADEFGNLNSLTVKWKENTEKVNLKELVGITDVNLTSIILKRSIINGKVKEDPTDLIIYFEFGQLHDQKDEGGSMTGTQISSLVRFVFKKQKYYGRETAIAKIEGNQWQCFSKKSREQLIKEDIYIGFTPPWLNSIYKGKWKVEN